jgi:hypothetical protein
MFKKTEDAISARIDQQITQLLDFMDRENDYSDDYKTMANQLTKLIELRDKPDKISKDTWVTVGTHIAGLAVLMNHERAHVIASKAFGLLRKVV